MAKSLERIRACELRREGRSVKEIAGLLNVSRASASIWIRDIELTEAQRNFLRERQIASGHRGRMIGAEMNREKKRERIRSAQQQAISDIGDFSPSSLFFTGLGLYWGEGSKAGKGNAMISNSDPRVILVSIRWFTECLGVERSRFRPRIAINHLHKDRVDIVEEFWSKTLNLPLEQFSKTILLPQKNVKVYENHDVYYGVMALRVARSADIKYRILGQINALSNMLV